MKTKLAVVLLLMLIGTNAVLGQQGTVIIRDKDSNTQADVAIAGNATANLLGVQGNAAGVPIPVTGTVTVSSTTSNQGTPGSAAWPVVITQGTTVTAYAGTAGMTVLASGSTSAFTATTTRVAAIWCNNETASGVLVYITDGNNIYKIGPNYTLAAGANGALLNVPTGITFTSGIRMSAGTAAAVRCQVEGMQ